MSGQKWYYVLNSQNRAHVTRSIAEAIRTAPEGYILRLTEPNRSLDQNARIHAVLTEVGNMLGWKWNGFDVDVTDLKTVFAAAYRKIKGTEERLVPGIDNQPVNLSWHTSTMTKRECAEFMEMIDAWTAEYRRNNDVVMPQYREK